MARAPDKRIGQAKAMYLAGRKLVDIAEELGLPEGTVRRWKCTHKWDSERSDKEASVRKRGAQPGNKNSSGGPRGTGRQRNMGSSASTSRTRPGRFFLPSNRRTLWTCSGTRYR